MNISIFPSMILLTVTLHYLGPQTTLAAVCLRTHYYHLPLHNASNASVVRLIKNVDSINEPCKVITALVVVSIHSILFHAHVIS